MELLVCFMFIVVMLVQFVGLLAIYQLLAKNTNKQIERQTEYLEACFLERFNGFSSTIHHNESCQSTCQEPTVKCGTSPEAVQHNERAPDTVASNDGVQPTKDKEQTNMDEDEEMSSDDVDGLRLQLELPADVTKDCPMSVEYPLNELIQSTQNSTNDLAFNVVVHSARTEDVIIRNDSLGGKKAPKNVKIILNGDTKIESHCHINGTVHGLAIGDKNTVATMDNVTLDRHQSRDNQRRCKPNKRRNRKKRTPPDMKRDRKIKDPKSINQGAVNQTQQNDEQYIPSRCNNKESEITQSVQEKQPSTKETLPAYLKYKDGSLSVQDERWEDKTKVMLDICSNGSPEAGNPHFKETLCKKSCYDRSLPDMSDIDEGNIFDGYLFDDQYNSASRES